MHITTNKREACMEQSLRLLLQQKASLLHEFHLFGRSPNVRLNKHAEYLHFI